MAQCVYLAASFLQGSWVLDANWQPLSSDFVNIWSAGHQILSGDDPLAIYDVPAHKQAETAALGHAFAGEYPWIYPPTFLFIAASLALLPFVTAYAAWIAVTFAAYVTAIRGIVGTRAGVLLAVAYPGVLSNLIVGQNGFLTAALFGGSLLLLQRRPALAGCCMGLLSFKPHLGILFPLVLLAGGHWRALVSAACTAAMLGLAAWAAFGAHAWLGFFHALPLASQAALAEGRADWGKLQSVFALTRLLGGGEGLAWSLHWALVILVAGVLWQIWRSKRVAFDLKAAALSAGALLVTPYLFLYDLVLLAVAMAFLLRATWASTDARVEAYGIGLACLLVLLFPLFTAPLGLAAVLAIAALILRRAVECVRRAGRVG